MEPVGEEAERLVVDTSAGCLTWIDGAPPRLVLTDGRPAAELELASAVSEKDFAVPKIQVNVNPSMCAIKPFLIPFLGIEDLMKIDVSA